MQNFSGLLAQACQAAPSADNSQPCCFDWDGDNLTIRYDAARVAANTFPPDNPATLLTVGAIIENISQLLEAAGGSTKVTYWPKGKSHSTVYAEVGLKIPDGFNLPRTPHAWLERHTNRHPYRNTPLPPELICTLGNLTEGDSSIKTFTGSNDTKEIGKLVKSASEIRFQTKEVHDWLGKSLRFTPEEAARGDGLDLNTLGLPPGGRLLLKFICSWNRLRQLNRIGVYKLLAELDSYPIKAAPAIVAITGPNTPDGAISAGRLLCRSWIQLNTQAVAAHPYYVIPDQLARLKGNAIPPDLLGQAKDLKEKCKNVFSLPKGHTLFMLLRAGLAKKEAIRSKRLPTSRIFHESKK